jgi:hypothetical protein
MTTSGDQDWAWVDDEDNTWVPPAIDTEQPSIARVYDYLLGGKDHYAVDRAFAAKLLDAIPDAADSARANREFLISATRTMAEAGIRQFLDLGTGIPTSPTVHEIARKSQADAAVVYVDNDPVVLAHSRALLSTEPGVIAVQHDLRDPAAVLSDTELRQALDLNEPIGLLLTAVLHFVDPAATPRIVARYVHQLPIGSFVAMSVGCTDGIDYSVIRQIQAAYAGTAMPAVGRTEVEIEQLFEGLDVLPPGIVDCYRTDTARVLCGVGVKRMPVLQP